MAPPPDSLRTRNTLSDEIGAATRREIDSVLTSALDSATTAIESADSSQVSTYTLGRNVEKAIDESGMNVLFLVAVSIPLVRGVGRFINIRERLPSFQKLHSRFWVLGVAYYLGIMALGLRYSKADDLYVLLVLGVTVALLLLVRDYRPARTLLLGLLPLAVVKAGELLLHAVAPDTLQFYSDGFGSAQGFSVLWLIGFSFVARSHKRQAEAERLEREAAALEKHRIEAQNAALEQMVAERTASLTRQTQELRETLEELRITQGQLIQSEKMASLGELTAGIAHEIQNPLNFVTNFADVSAELLHELEEEQQRPTRDLALETELLTDLRQNLTKITHHGQRAASIVRGMLEHSRASTGERLPTDLNQLTDEYLRLAYHGLRAKNKSFNATLHTDLAPDLPLVEAVGPDVGRVLLNLFTNAFYAVQKRREQLPNQPDYVPTVRVRTRPLPGGGVQISVRDNGTGIPEAVRQKIFQPFFTTKPAGEGTGLGLSLSYDIITKGHNGTLSLETEEGQGTEFIIELPG